MPDLDTADIHRAFTGSNLRALSAAIGQPMRRVRAAIFRAERERLALLSLVKAGASLSPAQQARLDRLQAPVPRSGHLPRPGCAS